MILKIALYGGDEYGKRWEFIDDVATATTYPVFIRRVELQQGEKGNRGGHFLKAFMDKAGTEPCAEGRYSVPQPLTAGVLVGDKDVCRVTGILLMSRAGVGTSVVLHEGYLLNDEGKTIERL